MDKILLEKYIEGTVSSEERDEVVDWLDADPKHVEEYMRLHKVYNISILNQEFELESPVRKNNRKRLYSFMLEIGKVAAVVLSLLVIQYFLRDTAGQDFIASTQTIYSPAGQRTEVLLPDSTKVWLNACSKLVYPITFQQDNRTVQLEGEAYFDVKKNQKIPFIVQTDQFSVKVLGTEFNILSYGTGHSSQISLLEGSIELSSKTLKEPYFMHPGEMVTIENNRYTTSQISEYDHYKWRDGLICFFNESVADIFQHLQLYYDVTIHAEDLNFLHERYTGKFRSKDGVEQVLKILQLEYSFTYTKDTDTNIITIY